MLKQQIINNVVDLKIKYREDKIKFAISSFLFFFLFFFFFSCPAFSYSKLHILPIVIMFVITIFTAIYEFLYNRFFVDKLIVAIIIYMLFVVVSCIFNGFQFYSTSYYLLPFFFIILYHLFSINRLFYNLSLKLFACGMLLFGCYFILLNYKALISLEFFRLGSSFGDENVIGTYFAMGALLSLYYVLFKKDFLFLIPALLLFVLGLTTGSKAYILIVGLSIIFFIFALNGKKRIWLSCLILSLLLVAFVLLLQLKAFATIKQRVLDFFDFLAHKKNDESTSGRIYYIFEAMFLFLKNPIVGYGIKGFARNSTYGIYTHNTVMELLVNFGIVAMISFEIPLFYSLNKIRKKDNDNYIIDYFFIILIIIGTLTYVQFLDKLYFLQLAFFAASYKLRNPKDSDLFVIKFCG